MGHRTRANSSTLPWRLRHHRAVTHYHCGMFKNSNRINYSIFRDIYRALSKQKYLMFATVVSVLACIFANVGLTKIIMYSTPVLMFIYPLAITLILLTLASPLFNHSKVVYRFTTFFTMIAAFIDGVKASPEFFAKTSFARFIISFR